MAAGFFEQRGTRIAPILFEQNSKEASENLLTIRGTIHLHYGTKQVN